MWWWGVVCEMMGWMIRVGINRQPEMLFYSQKPFGAMPSGFVFSGCLWWAYADRRKQPENGKMSVSGCLELRA